MLKESAWNFYHIGFARRHERKCHGPKVLTNKGQGIGKGRQGFVIPSGLTQRHSMPIKQLLSKECHQRKKSQQSRSGAQNSQIGPLSLGLNSQMGSDFMKGHFDLPTQDKPFDDLDWTDGLISAQQGLWIKLAIGVTNKYPAQRDCRLSRMIPDRCSCCHFHHTSLVPVPFHGEGFPRGLGIS